MSVLRTGRGRAGVCVGGGGELQFLTEKKISAEKCSWGFKRGGGRKISGGGLGVFGAPHAPPAPPGGREGSENDTLLPMTMTCDRLKFWSGPAWRSKVIIRKPWRRKKKKEKKKL